MPTTTVDVYLLVALKEPLSVPCNNHRETTNIVSDVTNISCLYMVRAVQGVGWAEHRRTTCSFLTAFLQGLDNICLSFLLAPFSLLLRPSSGIYCHALIVWRYYSSTFSYSSFCRYQRFYFGHKAGRVHVVSFLFVHISTFSIPHLNSFAGRRDLLGHFVAWYVKDICRWYKH